MIALFVVSGIACANDEAALDATPESAIKLIKSMVDHGALTPDKAQSMIKDVEQQTVAARQAALSNVDVREQIKREVLAEMKGQLAEDIKRQVLAELTGATSTPTIIGVPVADVSSGVAGAEAAGAKPKSRVVRVPYVPESMRREIREQIKQEVLTQAVEERWGTPNALPEWLGRFNFEGDVRLRYESFTLGKGNAAPGQANYYIAGLTRAPDFAGPNGNPFAGLPNANTQQDFSRERLRLRFGANVKVSDTVSAGFRIATGNITGPTSTNQTLGQGQNKYSLVLDRGFVTIKPFLDWSLTGGRIANPFMSTDLVWADDLSFEGVALTYTPRINSEATAFLTAGWFPLRTDNPSQTTARDLKGFQGGVKWKLTPTTDFNIAAALYQYHGVEGQREDPTRIGVASDYGVRYEYPSSMRQRGNTLFEVNAFVDPSTTSYWGLASGFNELNLTSTLDIARFDPFHIVLTADYVKNLDFDRSKMSKRSGSTIIDGKGYGYLGKVMVGNPAMTRWGDWNVSLAYRWLGSDAVIDAFTNSDFGMGGTNNKGYVIGGNWAIDKNAWISARWMASELIDSAAPKTSLSTAGPTQFKADVLQIDLNAKF